MTFDQVKEIAQARPFRPFSMETTGGKNFQLSNPFFSDLISRRLSFSIPRPSATLLMQAMSYRSRSETCRRSQSPRSLRQPPVR